MKKYTDSINTRAKKFFIFLTFCVLAFLNANSQTTKDLTSCWAGSNCTSGDFTIAKIYLASDLNGTPLTSTSCSSPGAVVDVYLAVTFTNTTSSDRNGIFLSGNIMSGGSSNYIHYCFNGLLPKKQSKTFVAPDKFKWTCGQPITLENGFTGWNSASGPVCVDDSKPVCSGTTISKCRSYPSQVIITPLVANFTSTNSCLGGAQYETISFTSTTTGGTTPYTYKWEYSPDGITYTQFSTTPNSTFTPGNSNPYYVRLTVTDATSPANHDDEVKSGVTAGTCCTTPVIANQTPAGFCTPGSVSLSASDFTGTNTIPSGTTYSWPTPTASGISGLTSGTNATSFSTGQLTNTTNAPISITYNVTPKSGACTGNAFIITVTVNALPTITGTLSVCVGSTTQLTGSGTAASNAWLSSDPLTATVSSQGLVTGVKAGTAAITFTNSDGCQKTATVTVNALPNNPQVDVIQPTCTNSNGTVTVTSPLGTDYEYSNNGGTYQESGVFTVAGGVAYSIKVRRISTQCVSSGVASGTMGSASPVPPADVQFISQPSCSSSTGSLKIVKAGGGDYDNAAFEFSSDGTTFGSSSTFTFTAGQGYSITVRRKSDPTCTATATCTGETATAAANSAARQSISTEQMIELKPQPTVTATPNPFSTQVKFSLKSHLSGHGTLELYNLLGQKVKTVFDGYVEAGQVKNIEYNAPGTQSANLLYVFRVGDQKVTGKLIKLK